MPNSYPFDGIFNPNLTMIKDSYILIQFCTDVQIASLLFVFGLNKFCYHPACNNEKDESQGFHDLHTEYKNL